MTIDTTMLTWAIFGLTLAILWLGLYGTSLSVSEGYNNV
jgi:hypothetical protein